MKKLSKYDLVNSILVSLWFAFMLGVFAPFEIYLSNKGYFFFEGFDMLPIAIIFTIILFGACMVILLVAALIGHGVWKVVFGMFAGGTLALYLQGNWDTTDYGAWDGSEIDFSNFSTQMLIFGAVFVVLIVGFAVLNCIKTRVFAKIIRFVSVIMSLTLIATLAILLLTNNGLSKDTEYISTTENELELSHNDNMLMLVLDAYDSAAFEALLAKDKKYSDMLDGFTYYPDTLSLYSSTDMSMPHILTGSEYKNEEPFGEYLDQAFESSPFMKWLDDHNWEKDIYSGILLPQGNEGAGIDNSYKLKRYANDQKALMQYIYTMVLFRYTPQPLKNHFYFYADNIKGTLGDIKGDYTPYTEDNFAFNDKLDELTAAKEQNVFQLIHISGAHVPFTFDENFQTVYGDEDNSDTTSYEAECQGILVVVERFINKLKENGCYDNTVIFIMADHGFYDSKQNPLLLVKGRKESHELKVSTVPVSYVDLQDVYVDLLEERINGNNAFDKVATEGRIRYFRSVPWNTHLNFDNYSGDIFEITTTDNAKATELFVDSGICYPEKDKLQIH